MDLMEFLAFSLLAWIFLGIFPSVFLSLILFPVEKFGLFSVFVIYFIGIGFFFCLNLIFDKIKFSSNRFLKWFCGFH